MARGMNVDRSTPVKPLPRSFYQRSAVQVAKDLLGKYFVRKLGKNTLVGKIVETEAYREGDPASHSYRGRTRRNEVMFWRGGHLYVYFTYGMHYCANVVTGPEGTGEAVLIRAVEPIKGIEVMRKKRRGSTGAAMKGREDAKENQGVSERDPRTLTNGPAKFCQAFGIGRKENGIDLLGNQIFVTNGENIPPQKRGRSRRIGIRNGKDKPWRFFVKGNAWVSR
jgi:DNA-3-methyladenine glycosylase